MSAGQRVDALCLSCGTVRTVAAGYLGRSGERRLRCTSCSAGTMHGSAAGVSDHRERANARAILRTGDPWAIVEARGWQVVEVPGLNGSACIVRSQHVVLICAGYDETDQRWIAERVLPMLESDGDNTR